MPDLGVRKRNTLMRLLEEASAADDPIDRLRPLVSLAARSQQLMIETVAEARAAGATWTQIGDVLGVTKQAVLQRFGAGGRYDVEAITGRKKK